MASAQKRWQALVTPQPGTREVGELVTPSSFLPSFLFSALLPTKKVTADVLRPGGFCQMAPESGGGYQVGSSFAKVLRVTFKESCITTQQGLIRLRQ